ncbi:MAG: hypothetical protein AABX31_04260 [Nanoarchaeota archaeon]
MESIEVLLERAEERWRGEVNDNHPLWSAIPVIKEGKPGHGGDWHFSTDLKQIFALIFNDENLQKKFTELVPKYWDGKPEELALHTLHYLLYHELYHPLEAPKSKEDDRKIRQAIRRGIIKAEPTLSPLEQVLKVRASQNAVKDFILDNRFAVDNTEGKYVRDDVIPIWNVIDLHDEPAKTGLYTVMVYMYGKLYGPAKAHSFFADKTGEKGVTVAEEAMKALLKQGSDALSKPADYFEQKDELVKAVREVFAGNGRYAGIERFMAVLSPYIEKTMPKGRCGYHGEGSGSSWQDILLDLLEDMSEREQQQFLTQIARQIQNSNNSEQFSDINEDEELNTLELSAIHEFYKRNHPKVNIVGGAKKAETISIGKDERFFLKDTAVLTEEQLRRLNLNKIARFQQRTRLPTLITLPNGLYRLNQYDIKERERKSIAYVDQSLDLSDVYEFYLDSSGSMYGRATAKGFNDGSSWDMLSSVLYGYIDALYQASVELGKPSRLQFHNFADQQLSSAEVDVRDFWERAQPDLLKVLFRPENGYGVEDLSIQMHYDGKKRTCVIVTDGNLVIDGRTERESKKMKHLAEQPNTHVLLFEIDGSYKLGQAVKSDPNIHYFPVYDKNTMFRNGLEVLLGK